METEDRPICDRSVQTVGKQIVIRDEYGRLEERPLSEVNPRRLWRWLRWKASDWRT